ncbi:hypothetical protein H4R20_002183 [Coemansia guatemalensis]|uniref:Uncharacterized protein n=1 Tax=Coemansia guatemalensis TaxID=2761395 RepID=A0A9W8LSI7_9FUNG|nr:hypothetical protein H4R20_002183 [Coemansia guatemalensis]
MHKCHGEPPLGGSQQPDPPAQAVNAEAGSDLGEDNATPGTGGVNNENPVHYVPPAQLANQQAAPSGVGNHGEDGLSTDLTLRILLALEGINEKLDMHLLPAGTFASLTTSAAVAPTGTIVHCAPEGSATAQRDTPVFHAPEEDALVVTDLEPQRQVVAECDTD